MNAANKTNNRTWCRIIEIDGVSVLFYEEYNLDAERHQITAKVKTDVAMFAINVTSTKAFTERQFNDFATEKVARAAIDQAGRFGLNTVLSSYPREDEPC